MKYFYSFNVLRLATNALIGCGNGILEIDNDDIPDLQKISESLEKTYRDADEAGALVDEKFYLHVTALTSLPL